MYGRDFILLNTLMYYILILIHKIKVLAKRQVPNVLYFDSHSYNNNSKGLVFYQKHLTVYTDTPLRKDKKQKTKNKNKNKKRKTKQNNMDVKIVYFAYSQYPRLLATLKSH